jgi:hypothetical protein
VYTDECVREEHDTDERSREEHDPDGKDVRCRGWYCS